jgi:anti-sigma factor RsiW
MQRCITSGWMQVDDQLLRARRQWKDPRQRSDSRHTFRSGPLDEWTAAMEATVFTGWIYDHLLPHAAVPMPAGEQRAVLRPQIAFVRIVTR